MSPDLAPRERHHHAWHHPPDRGLWPAASPSLERQGLDARGQCSGVQCSARRFCAASAPRQPFGSRRALPRRHPRLCAHQRRCSPAHLWPCRILEGGCRARSRVPALGRCARRVRRVPRHFQARHGREGSGPAARARGRRWCCRSQWFRQGLAPSAEERIHYPCRKRLKPSRTLEYKQQSKSKSRSRSSRSCSDRRLFGKDRCSKESLRCSSLPTSMQPDAKS